MEQLTTLFEEWQPFLKTFWPLGALWAAVMAKTVWVFVFCSFLRSGKNPRSYGEWAVVTGSTDGIGKALAMSLAKRKMNIVLISRTQAKLDEVEKEINEKFPEVKTLAIAQDLVAATDDEFAAIGKQIAMIDVGMLVNNAGVSYKYAEFFDKTEPGKMEELLRINNLNLMKLTRVLYPSMVMKRRGCILNIGSAAGCMCDPLYACYSGSKAFVEFFTRTLNAERKFVDVQCALPMLVATKMSRMRKGSIMVATPKQFAEATMSHVGRETVFTPFWSHKLQLGLINMLGHKYWSSIRLGMTTTVRKKAYKKYGLKEE